MSIEITRYELPPEGITLLGYIVRRMHKTEWLAKASAALTEGKTEQALEFAAVYAAAASTSFGRAYYQPRFNRVGDQVREADPTTGAMVTAKLESDSPHYHITYEAVLPNGDTFKGSERITGTTIGWHGLGMPAPSKFTFTSGDYIAEFEGILTSELAISFFRKPLIRAYGFLNIKDNRVNVGRLELSRAGEISLRINEQRNVRYSCCLDYPGKIAGIFRQNSSGA
jgi:hypothetical protein